MPIVIRDSKQMSDKAIKGLMAGHLKVSLQILRRAYKKNKPDSV